MCPERGGILTEKCIRESSKYVFVQEIVGRMEGLGEHKVY